MRDTLERRLRAALAFCERSQRTLEPPTDDLFLAHVLAFQSQDGPSETWRSLDAASKAVADLASRIETYIAQVRTVAA